MVLWRRISSKFLKVIEENILYGVYPNCREFFTPDSALIGQDRKRIFQKGSNERSLVFHYFSVSITALLPNILQSGLCQFQLKISRWSWMDDPDICLDSSEYE